MQCERCGVEDPYPFACSYCGRVHCAEHRLPENHNCTELWMTRPPITRRREGIFDRSRYRRLWFSKRELQHLAVGVLLVALVALSLRGFSSISIILTLLFTASFLLHELAHKFTAQRSGLWSEFRLVSFGAMLTAFSIISPLKIIAPGAVMISGAADPSTIGKTAVAGPVTNILLGFGLLLLSSLTPNTALQYALYISAHINGILAAFNLIPFGIFDGQKVMAWSLRIWGVTVASAIVLIIVAAV